MLTLLFLTAGLLWGIIWYSIHGIGTNFTEFAWFLLFLMMKIKRLRYWMILQILGVAQVTCYHFEGEKERFPCRRLHF